MQYREFGRTGWKVSALGFGAMRLPTLDNKPYSKRIDRREAVRIIRHALDNGVNYVDTAYGYHGGQSEGLVARALSGGYGDGVKVATKSPVWLIDKPGDFDKHLKTQLKRLERKSIDFYLLHGLNSRSWKDRVVKHKVLKSAGRALRDGRIGHLGFSFHDDFKTFRHILEASDNWSFCQIQYNYMDTENQAGTKGLKLAASNGLGVVVMEPLLGGRLARSPQRIRNIIHARGGGVSPVELALQWIWDQPEVSTVLSGMSTMAQVKGNLRYAGRSGPGTLSAKDRALVARVRKEYEKAIKIKCTKCGYCMPCKNGVLIPENFQDYNEAFMHGDLKGGRRIYQNFFNPKLRADACKRCRECEEKCPQGLPISDLLAEVDAVLGKK